MKEENNNPYYAIYEELHSYRGCTLDLFALPNIQDRNHTHMNLQNPHPRANRQLYQILNHRVK